MTSVTQELELRIGKAPWTGDISGVRIVNHDMRITLRAWLVSKGLNESRVNRMQDGTLEKAYNLRNYYYTLTDDPKNMTRRGSFAARNVGADVFDESHDMHSNVNAAIFEDSADVPLPPITAPPVHPNEVQGISAAELARVVDAAITPRTEKMRRDLDAIIEAKIKNTKLELSEDTKKLIRSLAMDAGRELFNELMPPRTLRIEQSGTHEAKDLGLQHFKFEELLRSCAVRNHEGFRQNIWLTGPTGSGKTSAARNVAYALDLEFEAESSLDADYKVTGFFNAAGVYVETAFFRRFTKGGVMVLDEIDNWNQSALLAVNAPLANGWAQFPHGRFDRHPDFICIACANTWGLGATNDYVGRSRLDAASLDRFGDKIDWPYDEQLEHAIAAANGGEKWCRLVQEYRRKAKTQGLHIIISPRATFNGIGMLQQGFTEEQAIDKTFAAGLKPEQRTALGLPPVIQGVTASVRSRSREDRR